MSTPSPQDAPGTYRGMVKGPTRKPPPTPLAISSSTQSRLRPPPIADASPAAAPSNTPSPLNNISRNSLDSTRSDLASARSELTSLHVNEFPLPPSALPTIPASPRTPRSLHFSTTPRSQSPASAFVCQLPELANKVGGSNSKGPVSPSHHGYDLSREPGPARYSQYAVYKESNVVTSPSRSVTPTTAGSGTTRDWPTSSDQRSSLHPPRPTLMTSETSPRSSSPLRDTSFSKQQDKHQLSKNSAVLPPSPRITQPPNLPLPIPPRSPRESTSYSHIARNAGVTDMGVDTNEEGLLSTDFISGLLAQPVASSPRVARFTRLPDSPPSPSFLTVATEEGTGLSDIIDANDIHLVPKRSSTIDSPRISAPKSIATSDLGVRDSVDNPDDTQIGTESPVSMLGGVDWPLTRTRKMRSGLASSVYPNGGDRIVEPSPGPTSPSFPVSSNSQTLTVPGTTLRSHNSPHPMMPSTPVLRESFASALSPRSPQGFARAQANIWRNPPTSQSLATRLPIGARTPPSQAQSQISPRIRQHHYPRNGPAKREITSKGNPPLHAVSATSHPTDHVQLSSTSADKAQSTSNMNTTTKAKPGPSNVTVPELFTTSAPSSIHTQRDSIPPSPQTLEDSPASDSLEGASEEATAISASNRRSSVVSSYQASTDLGVGGNDSTVGEIQTANRVWTATSQPVIRAADKLEAKPTVVGMAPAVILHQKLDEPRDPIPTVEPQTLRRPPLDALVTPPASPHGPPSIHLPLAHRTDMPESVKSLGLTEDVHGINPDRVGDAEDPHLPRDEVAGYGSSIFLEYQGSSSNVYSPKASLQRQRSKHGASFKSIASYITTRTISSVTSRESKISNKSNTSSRWAWLKRKPLPPLPPPSAISEDSGWSHISQDPTYTSVLPRRNITSQSRDPAGRTGNLRIPIDERPNVKGEKDNVSRSREPHGWSDESGFIEKGGNWLEHPPLIKKLGLKSSAPTFEMFTEGPLKTNDSTAQTRNWEQIRSPDYGPKGTDPYLGYPKESVSIGRFVIKTRGKLWLWFPLAVVLVMAAIIAIALGATLGHKHAFNVTTGDCSGNVTGSRCNLNATCICPASQSGICSAPLAQALSELVPIASQLFATNITARALAVVLWEIQGTPINQNCASQANLIDVGSVLDSATLPNRTHWAQAALLWSLFQSGNITATQSMLSDINMLPFQLLQHDGPQTNSSNQFAVTSSGYIFNFASQTVKAPLLTFRDDASPPLSQLNALNSIAQSSLDRMYSYASASSIQRATSLSTYWESVLSFDLNDLPQFISAFITAPIILPFDVMSSPGGYAISDILRDATNRTLSFPPSLGCFPGLSPSQLQRISAVETHVFGLSNLSSSPSDFDSSCFPNRPVYGVMDVLRTRLAFSDSRSGVAKQAAVLSSNASLRAVLHVGELLSALPASNITELSLFNLNPRRFGTSSHINHVILDWLQAFATTADAMAAANFLLSSPSSPPSPNSTLFNSTTLPIVEAAVFGTIFLSDLSAFRSSFSTPSGGLFFGSSQGDSFRHWGLQNSSQAKIAWSPTNFAPLIVLEGSSTDVNFERIWSGAASLISSAPGGVTGPSDVSKVTAAFFGS